MGYNTSSKHGSFKRGPTKDLLGFRREHRKTVYRDVLGIIFPYSLWAVPRALS